MMGLGIESFQKVPQVILMCSQRRKPLFDIRGFQSVVSRLAASPGNLLEMWIIRHHPRSIESETLGT